MSSPARLGSRPLDLPRLFVATVLAALAVFVLGRGLWRAVRSSDDLVIGVDIWVGFAPLHLAQDLGYFEEEGLEVSLVTLKGTSEMRAALASDRVQGVTTSLDTALRNRAIGTPAQVALGLDRSAGADGLVARAPVDTVLELQGRQVAVQPATPSEWLLLFLLHDAGVPLGTVERIEMDSADAGAAFVAGKVDAAVTWEPWLGQAAQAEGAALLASTVDHPYVILDVLLLHDDLLDDRPEDVLALRRAWFRAVEYIRTEPEASAELLAPYYGVEPPVFLEMVSGLEYLDQPANEALFGDPGASPAGAVIDAANGIFLESGILERPVLADELVHPLASAG
jgi:NitT/TauT family transport system substrate-binding protein